MPDELRLVVLFQSLLSRRFLQRDIARRLVQRIDKVRPCDEAEQQSQTRDHEAEGNPASVAASPGYHGHFSAVIVHEV